MFLTRVQCHILIGQDLPRIYPFCDVFLNIFRISASNVLKMFLSIIVNISESTCGIYIGTIKNIEKGKTPERKKKAIVHSVARMQIHTLLGQIRQWRLTCFPGKDSEVCRKSSSLHVLQFWAFFSLTFF